MVKKLCVLAFVLISYCPIHGQLLLDRVMPPSPNAAALMKYCDHPIGVSSGIPRVKIPLATLINKDIIVPISLNYHALGVKVEEESTWTGLGWYLESGGMITRLIRGENDFAATEKKSFGSNALGYPFEHIKPCLDDCVENESQSFHNKVCDGEIDSDPDIYFFDILGVKGKFFLTPDHDPRAGVLTMKMTYPKNMTFSYITGENSWKVVDESGFEYHFKTIELTETHSNYFDYKIDSHKIHFKYFSKMATTTWYLNRVVSPTGSEAIFTYDLHGNGTSPYASNGAHHKMNINDEDIWDVHYSTYCFPEDIENVQILSESIYSDVYLKSIDCGEFMAVFDKSARKDIISPATMDRPRACGSDFTTYFNPQEGPQKLDQITIHNASNSESIRFKYGYFNENTNDSIPRLFKRLKLESMTKTSTGQVQTTQFYYNERVSLPSKESHARDLWGYYNGEEDFYNITPSDFFNYSQPEKLLQEEGRTKHYSLEHIMAGTLVQIDHGHGLIQKFEYDHQEFMTINSEIASYFDDKMKGTNFNHAHQPYISGGLRIAKITELYPQDTVYKQYSYLQNNIESGVLSITGYNHAHRSLGHRTSGNHHVQYDNVNVKLIKVKP